MEFYTIAIVLHVIGAVIGVGTVTIHDLQLFRAIGDRDLGIAYQKSATFYSRLIQGGLLLLVASGLYFMFSRPVLWSSEKIVTKLALVGLLIVNGIVISFVLHPKSAKLSGEDWARKTPALVSIVRSRLPFDAISISAWYSVLFLGAVGRQQWSAAKIVIGYLIFLAIVYIVIRLVSNKRLGT